MTKIPIFVQGAREALKMRSRNLSKINKNPSLDPKVSFVYPQVSLDRPHGPRATRLTPQTFAKPNHKQLKYKPHKTKKPNHTKIYKKKHTNAIESKLPSRLLLSWRHRTCSGGILCICCCVGARSRPGGEVRRRVGQDERNTKMCNAFHNIGARACPGRGVCVCKNSVDEEHHFGEKKRPSQGGVHR